MKTYGGVEIYDGGQWPAAHSDRFPPREKVHQYPLNRGFDGHQSGSGAEKICYTFTESNLDSMVVQPIAYVLY
jgi:hypothetical protein